MAKKDASTAAPRIPAPPPTDPSALEALARRFSGPTATGARAREWDEASVKSCMAAVMAALRQKSADKLDAAIDQFGGLPPQNSRWNAAQPLAEAAKDPGAFGFAAILGVQLAEAMGREEPPDLGRWLRDGLANSAWDDSAPWSSGRDLDSGVSARPVAAALRQDNPMALAQSMKDPERFEALAAMEPRPAKLPGLQGIDDSMQESCPLLRAARSAEASFEVSLLWHAVSLGAYRCAGMLASMPEFSAPLSRPGTLASTFRNIPWARRSPQELFQEEPKVEFSFYEWAMGQRARVEGTEYGDRERLRASWTAMAEAMVDAAPARAVEWRQKGTGMGWPEIYFARTQPHRWGNQSGNERAQAEIADAMSMLAKMEARGFDVPWSQLAEISESCSELSEWMSMRAATAGSPGAAAPRRSKSL